jgi:CRISPR/Cas system CSM-associated protein Csm3 (group 7 of RAMP superfamily)
MNVWKIELRLCSDFHSAGETRGSVIHVLKSGITPYIPGSHIKGMLRTEAERIWFSTHGGVRNCYLTGAPDGTEKNPAGVEKCKDEDGCPICSLFGVPEQEEKSYAEAKVKFTDFFCSRGDNESERAHVKIRRNTGAKEERALFTEKTVARGSVFTGFILMRTLEEAEEKLLHGALRSASDYGFGGGRTRGLGCVDLTINVGTMDGVKELLRGGWG